MIPLSVEDVGPVALARMLRDGVVAYLAPGHGIPFDLGVSRETRARTLAGVVPGHTVVSGLAGLWVHFGGTVPGVVDLVGARGLHRAKPGADARGWTLAFHSGGAVSGTCDAFAGMAVANPERCAADALRWRNLATAMAIVYDALRSGLIDRAAMQAIVDGDDVRGLGASRARSAWDAIATVTTEPPSRSAPTPRPDAIQ